MSTDIDLPRVIKDIASDIAGLLRDHYGLDQYSVVIGENVMGDLTRKIDIIAEDYAIDAIHKTGLKTWVVSEERGLYKLCEKPDYIVLLDPLDGSANYVSQIPFAAVSMAIYRVNGDPRATYTKPIYGVVENIFTRDIYEVFNATVFVNGVRINTYLDRDNHVFSIYSEDIDEINVIDRYFKELG
ncbi:MAG: inositol monophosphatase family protein, partial [Desulfurococcaceae archaeon]